MAKKKVRPKPGKGTNGVARPLKAKKTVEVHPLPVNYGFPEGQQAIFSNSFVVQHQKTEFFLMFFEINPPLVLGDTQEERTKQVSAIESVEAMCVARIVVSADRIPSIIQALTENLERHAKRFGTAGVEFVDASGNVVDSKDV